MLCFYRQPTFLGLEEGCLLGQLRCTVRPMVAHVAHGGRHTMPHQVFSIKRRAQRTHSPADTAVKWESGWLKMCHELD